MNKPLIILSILACATGFAASAPQTVAVTDLAGQGVEQSSAAIITDRLRTELFSAGGVTVIERQAMQDILKEQGFQQTGCVTDQCMVEMGQLLGVSRIVSGTIGKLGQLYTLNVRVVNVATAQILYITSVDCKCAVEDVLTGSVPEIARRIAKNLGGQAGKPAAEAPAQQSPSPAPVPQAPRYGNLVVKSDPPAARVAIDGAEAGLTPFSSDSLSPGSHTLQVSLPDYDTATATLQITAGRSLDRAFTLKHSKAWSDSVRAAERASKAAAAAAQPKRKSAAPKVILGVAAVGTASAGVIFDRMINGRIDDNTRIKADYVAANDPSRSGQVQQELDNNAAAANKLQLSRNAAYVVSGLCVIGFGVSFAF